jgi:hypothetical protein
MSTNYANILGQNASGQVTGIGNVLKVRNIPPCSAMIPGNDKANEKINQTVVGNEKLVFTSAT